MNFGVSAALQISEKWTERLRQEISDYKREHDAEKRRRKEEREAQKRQEEERNRQERWERAEREEEELQERKRIQAEKREKSFETLIASPYNFTRQEAEKYILASGEIDKTSLTRYENDKRNKELIAAKQEAWRAETKSRQIKTDIPNKPKEIQSKGNNSPSNYYETHKATIANAPMIHACDNDSQHFPTEGLYIGNLTGGIIDIPALYDIAELKGLCFLYNNDADRLRVNACIERLVWRLAMTVPSNLCEFILYNGGCPGDSFNAHSRINKYLFDGRSVKVFFDGNIDAFSAIVADKYASIAERMSAIRLSGKKNLLELSESQGKDARLKYTFFMLTDFPSHITNADAQKIAKIVEIGSQAGIHVLMSWDMNADFEDNYGSAQFDHQQMLNRMQLLFPQKGRYLFRNSGHDESFNRFHFEIDDAPMNAVEIEKHLSYIDNLVEVAKSQSKPSALKQDFKGLEAEHYSKTLSEINITVGLDVNDKRPVTFRFDSGDCVHGFILGQSGSGKSVLLNNIITSAILKYSPQDLMLYLLDFKGVEFNRYRGVKHTKAVLVDNSDLQMTLEVLRELKEENKKRIKLWQKERVNNIDGYNEKHPNKRLPQILFVADECQVMFKETTRGYERIIQQEIQEILNVIATQGRSQGIHMLLATQQLDETDISGQIMKNLTDCFLLMSAPSDSDRLVPDSSILTSKQMTGIACYYHKRKLQSQVQTFFATNEELKGAIDAAIQKASSYPSNGEHYFCGSSLYYLADSKEYICNNTFDCPVAVIGYNIGINAGVTSIPLRCDYMEHILFWGVNKEEQTTGVLLNAFISLIMSYQQHGIHADFLVIDCLQAHDSKYRIILKMLAERGMCSVVERKTSGNVLYSLAKAVKNNTATPTVLAIIGSERFIEVKRKMTIHPQVHSTEVLDDVIEPLCFNMSSMDLDDNTAELDGMTYPQALTYLLEEGSMQDVHILMQVDKPSNVLFSDEYDLEAAMKFRHKVILKSENKYLNPLRFSQDIDVEGLGDEVEQLRAYYYPDGDDPILFTPFQMPLENSFAKPNNYNL